MGQDPNQPYSNPYGQPPSGGMPPQQGSGYYQGYSQQPPNPGYQQPPNPGYQQPPQYGQQYGQPMQQGYQQPYGQPGAQGQFNAGSPLGPSTLNMAPNVAGGLSYFTWVAGLIFFLIEKQNRFVRFNAMQCMLLTATIVILQIVLGVVIGILGAVSTSLALLSTPIYGLIYLAAAVIWIICIINAFQGKYFKLPLIGDYAERWSGGGMGTPLR